MIVTMTSVAADFFPTYERIIHARSAGLGVHEADVLTPSGQTTGRKRVQIQHPLETFFRKNLIGERQYVAGMRFREMLVSSMRSQRVVADYVREIRSSGGTGEGEAEREVRRRQDFLRACSSIPYAYRPAFIGWMVDCEARDSGLHDLGSRFTRRRRKDELSKTAKDVLEVVLSALSRHLRV